MILGLLLSCVKENSNIKQDENNNLFIGTWESVDRFYPYKAHLIINKDSTFYFKYGACTASGFSKGVWISEDTIIDLKSLDIDSCMFLYRFGEDCEILNVDSPYVSEIIVEKTISGCDPIDYVDYVLFENEEFYLDGDTLRHIIKGDKLCPKIRNDFFKIIKDTTANKRIKEH